MTFIPYAIPCPIRLLSQLSVSIPCHWLHHACCCRYAVDTFRWYICREAIFGSDLAFSKRAMVLAHNAELCNTFGNLVHRSLSLMQKYNDGELFLMPFLRYIVAPPDVKYATSLT